MFRSLSVNHQSSTVAPQFISCHRFWIFVRRADNTLFMRQTLRKRQQAIPCNRRSVKQQHLVSPVTGQTVGNQQHIAVVPFTNCGAIFPPHLFAVGQFPCSSSVFPFHSLLCLLPSRRLVVKAWGSAAGGIRQAHKSKCAFNRRAV